MNEDIQDKINELVGELRKSSEKTAVSFRLFVNCEGVDTEIAYRHPESLRQAGITMRNLRGDFIK